MEVDFRASVPFPSSSIGMPMHNDLEESFYARFNDKKKIKISEITMEHSV